MLQKLNFLLLRAQLVRNDANTVLGRVRPGRSRELRIGRYQSVHQVLGYADVRHVLGDQHRRFTQSIDRHDESFLPIDLRECYLHLTLYRPLSNFARILSFFLSSSPKKGTRRHRVEVRQEQALDQLLRGGWHGPTPVQHHPHPEERLVHGPMAVQETVRTQQSGQERAHEDDQSEISYSTRCE